MDVYLSMAESTSAPVEHDVARAVLGGLGRTSQVEPPNTEDFETLLRVIAQTTQMISHLRTFQELAIAKADASGPSSDRRKIGIAAAMPPSRLYRLLDQYGRPRNRSGYTGYDEGTQRMLAGLVKGHIVEGTHQGKPFTGSYTSQNTDENGDVWLVLTDQASQKPVVVPVTAVVSYH
jgi:hypothetical protein